MAQVRFCILITFSLVLGTISAQTPSAKRGMGVDNSKATLSGLSRLSTGASWFYNWNTSTVANYAESNLAYVPMTWSGGYNLNDLRTFLTAHPEIEYLLAFNEPNFKDQANMTPSQVAAAWKQLEAIADEFGLQLVSPAPNWCGYCVSENGVTYNDPYQYLSDFFAACPDCRVDYIAIHFYMGSVDALKGSLEKLYNDFHKPIWITEFNMDKNGMGDNGTIDEQRDFLVKAIDYLEQAPYIYRYAWFLARGGIITDLLSSPTELSLLGNVYANMSSYDAAFYHAINTRIEAEHYIRMSNISLVESTDTDGNLSVGYTEAGSTVSYQVDIPAAGAYTLRLRTAGEQATTITVSTDEQPLGTFSLPATGNWTTWQTLDFPIRLAGGKQTLTLQFNQAGQDLNWLSVLSTTSGLAITDYAQLTLYPNPATDRLNILADNNLQTVIIYDALGNKVLEQEGNRSSVDIATLAAGNYLLQIIYSDAPTGITLFQKQ